MSKKTKQKEQAIAVQPFDRDQKEKGKALRAWRQHRTYKRLMWLTMIIGGLTATLSYYAAYLVYPSSQAGGYTEPIMYWGLPVFPDLFVVGIVILFISWLFFAPLSAISSPNLVRGRRG